MLVVVDRFTKLPHFIPIAKEDSPTLVKAYLKNIGKFDGFPEDVVSDHDRTFNGQYFSDFYNYLGIQRSMSMTFHPRTYWEMERIHHVIKGYSRYYCNNEQHDWSEMVTMADIAFNNSKHSSTKVLRFYPNYRYQPRTNRPTNIQFKNTALEMYGQYMTSIHKKMTVRSSPLAEVMVL